MHTDKEFTINIPFTKQVGADGKLKLFGGIASSTSLDRDGDRIEKGVMPKIVSDLKKNSAVFFNHDTKGLAVGNVSLAEQRGTEVYVEVTPTMAKGMEDVVTQIQEGLLKNFSIGGKIKDWETVYDETLGKSVRVIKDVDCYEVSVVGVPSNQDASILSYLVKSFQGGSMGEEKKEEKKEDINKSESCAHDLMKCAKCGAEMKKNVTVNPDESLTVAKILDSEPFKKALDDFGKKYEEKSAKLEKELSETKLAFDAASARIDELHKAADAKSKMLESEQDELQKNSAAKTEDSAKVTEERFSLIPMRKGK